MKIDYKIENKEGAYVTASITIPRDAFQTSYKEILKSEAKKADIKGFRKGKVPQDMIEPELKQAASIQALDKLTPMYVTEIVKQENLDLIAPPEYSEFPNLEGDDDLILKIKFIVFPQVKLGDFKKIKVKKDDTKTNKEEIDNTIKEMFERSTIEEKGKNPDDKWAKKTGELYKLEGVKDLKTLENQITTLLEQEKQRIVRQNQEHEVLTKAIELSKIEIPEEAVEFEARERERSFLQELKRAELSVDEFCKTRETDFETLRKSWNRDAKEALEGEVLLRTYAKENEVKVSDEDLEKAIEDIKMNQEQEIPEDVEKDQSWRDNIRNVIMKQKAYRDLISKVLE
jgi:trigger factor